MTFCARGSARLKAWKGSRLREAARGRAKTAKAQTGNRPQDIVWLLNANGQQHTEHRRRRRLVVKEKKKKR